MGRNADCRGLYHSLILAGCSLAMIATAQAAERPNILFVFADDWGRYASTYAKALGPGSPSDILKTPNIDRIAARGVLFRNAFVNAPSCTPCRSSLLSGQYFWRTGLGAILQGAVWDATIPSYPLLLRDSGYHIGKSFKVWGPGTPADAPYGGQRHGYEKAGRRFNDFSENVTLMVAAGQGIEAAKSELLDEVSTNFASFLADRKDAVPFCYWFGPTLVHRRWVRGSGQALWGMDPEQLKGKLPPFLPDVPEIREDFADYLGEVQGLDAGVGRLLKLLEEKGELDKTVIVISGDHGAPGFPHGKCNLYDFGTNVPLIISGPGIPGGRIVDDLVSLPDLAPTFLELGGVTPPDVMTGTSLVPVLHSAKQGIVDPARSWVITGRERHVADARAGRVPYPQRALRTREYLYIVNFEPQRWPMGDPVRLEDPKLPSLEHLETDTYATFLDMDAGPTKAWLVVNRDDPKVKPYFDMSFAPRPNEELYVLADDPHQVKNVAAEANWTDIKSQLHAQLMAELQRTGDPRVTGDGKKFEEPPFVNPGQRPRKAR